MSARLKLEEQERADFDAYAGAAAALHIAVDTDMAEVMARDLDSVQAAIDKITRRWQKLFANGKARGGEELFQAATEALAVAQVSVRAGKDLLLGRGAGRTHAALEQWQRMRYAEGPLVGGYLTAPQVPGQEAPALPAPKTKARRGGNGRSVSAVTSAAGRTT
jgi:hypothetical protein